MEDYNIGLIYNIFFKDIIDEASKDCIKHGEIETDFIFQEEKIPTGISFGTQIYDEEKLIVKKESKLDVPILIIKDAEEFLIQLCTYVNNVRKRINIQNMFKTNKEYESIKYIIGSLFLDATPEDFKDPILFLKRANEFVSNSTFANQKEYQKIGKIKELLDGELEVKISKQNFAGDGTYKMQAKIVDSEDPELYFQLPEVGFSIDSSNGGKLYIYSVQDKRSKKNQPENMKEYTKTINKQLYRVNKGVYKEETEEYKEYNRKESDYYPENISDVSPSALVSLSILLAIVQAKGVNNIVVPSQCPMRWAVKTYANHANEEGYNNGLITKEELDRIITKNTLKTIEIYKNTTDKFLRNFRRLEHHFDNLKIESLPGDADLSMHLRNDAQVVCNNGILGEVYMKSQDFFFEKKEKGGPLNK